VHISAAATIRDDKQYLGLAQAIIDFEPARTTCFASSGGAGDDELESSVEPAHGVSEAISLVAHTSIHKNPLKLTRSMAESNSNPPYRNPLRKARTANVSDDTSPLRPRTAPELSSNSVLVPRTHSEIRRAFSDSFITSTSRVSNSQNCRSLEVSSDTRRSSPLANKGYRVPRLSQTSADHQPPTKRARLLPPSQTSPTFVYSRASDQKQPTQAGTLVMKSSPPQFYDFDADTQSDVTTASPSQPIAGEADITKPVDESPPRNSKSFISISSDDAPQQNLGLGNLHNMGQEMPSHPIAEQDMARAHLSFPNIDELSVEVVAPQPPVGDGKFSTHITQHLQDLIDKPQLTRIFRPIKIARDVKVLERGHWLMEITIAEDEVVRLARESPIKEVAVKSYTDRFAGTTAQERLTKYWQTKADGTMRDYDYGHEDDALGQWTENEFLTFWGQFSTFIQKGRAGWAVRMVRDESPADVSKHVRSIRVRIFTWGEVIAHIYLAVWLCSSKMATRIPMKWIASDGLVVVEMSGKKKYAGVLRPWVRKGPPGEDGSWGVAE
jgi:hypothetical protein